MPRVVKEDDYAARRNEILDVARKLVYTKGYEEMSIQDILDEMKISKGAFYHYFDSKSTLLEALIDRMGDEAEATFLPLLDDPALPALEKLCRYFSAAVQWKNAQRDYMLALRVPDPSTVRRWSRSLDRSQPAASFRRQTFARLAHWLGRGARPIPKLSRYRG